MVNDEKEKPRIIIERPKLPTHVGMFVSLTIIILAFFILLNAFSTIDDERKREALESISYEFSGFFDKAGRLFSLTEQTGESLEVEQGENQEGEEALFRIVASSADRLTELQRFGEAAGVGGKVGVVVTPRGMVVTMGEELSFAIGDDQLTESGRRFLDRFIAIVRPYRNGINIEGHTDDVAVEPDGRFASNWELSQARAMSVLRYLNRGGIDLERLSAAGAGQFRPLVENDSPEHRAINRRVEIIVRHPYLERPSTGS